MEALVLLGWEVRETPGTTATGSGPMEHPGTTVTGEVVSQMILGVKTVLRPGPAMCISGMIYPAAGRTPLFARKVSSEIASETNPIFNIFIYILRRPSRTSRTDIKHSK